MRDFDFDLPRTAPLTGYVLVPRAAAEVTAFKGRRLCPKGAWLHLYEIANTEPGETMLRGIQVHYEAGWVLWSVKKLAEAWGWDRETAGKFLAALAKAGWIEFRDATQYGRVIVLVDYRPAIEHITDTETSSGIYTETDTGLHTEGEDREGVEKQEGGKSAPAHRSSPTPEEVQAYAATAGIEADFAEDWFLKTANSARFGFETMLNWQLDLLRYWRLKKADGKKNAAPRPTWATAGDLRERIERHPANSRSAFYDPACTEEQRAALQKMRAQLRELKEEETPDE